MVVTCHEDLPRLQIVLQAKTPSPNMHHSLLLYIFEWRHRPTAKQNSVSKLIKFELIRIVY